MTILITAANGQLGFELHRAARRRGLPAAALDRAALDVTDASAVAAAMAAHRPATVINAAAYTAVDRAETDRDACFAVNGLGPKVLAEACAARGVPLIHVSTEAVFDGAGDAPRTPADPTAPVNVYGESKLAGERAVLAANPRSLVVRVSWVFGVHGRNFLKTILRLARERTELRVVDDQFGAPTPAKALAHALLDAAERNDDRVGGLYHYQGRPITTWHGFAADILEKAHAAGIVPHAVDVVAIPSEDYPLVAARPRNGRLDCSDWTRTFGTDMPDWRAAVDDVLSELRQNPHLLDESEA